MRTCAPSLEPRGTGRCAILRFTRLTDKQLAHRLKEVLETEKVPSAATAAAEAAATDQHGLLGRADQLVDQRGPGDHHLCVAGRYAPRAQQPAGHGGRAGLGHCGERAQGMPALYAPFCAPLKAACAQVVDQPHPVLVKSVVMSCSMCGHACPPRGAPDARCSGDINKALRDLQCSCCCCCYPAARRIQ
jgi:hypothetical protein